MIDRDYWLSLLGELRDPESAAWAAHMLAIGLGRGAVLEKTSLGRALSQVPRSELLIATIMAMANRRAHPYCHQVLWYFEPEEIVAAYEILRDPSPNVVKGMTDFLDEIESPLGERLRGEEVSIV